MDRAEFMESIRLEPESDELRLVFADWLVERGDPLGNFVRLQILQAKLSENDARQTELARQADRLLAQHEMQWLGPLAGVADDWRFRRGFVEYARLPAGAFVERAESIFETLPLTVVSLSDIKPAWSELLQCELLWCLQGLGLEGAELSTEGAAELAACPYVSKIRRLLLGHNQLGNDAVSRLAVSPHLHRLEVLDLNWNEIGSGGVRVLSLSPTFSQLEVLFLAHNQVGLQGVRALATSSVLRKLKQVDLRANSFDRRGTDVLRKRFGTDNVFL